VATVQRWTGKEAHALRQAMRLSVRGFARYLGVGVRTVAAWDAHGERIVPRPEMQAALDTALQQAGTDAHERFESFLAHDDRQPVGSRTGGRTGGRAAGEPPPAEVAIPAVAAIQAFRSADRRLGGGHLYATVINYLHADLASGLFGASADPGSSSPLAAAAALTEMAGWMAHDMGQDHAAQQHFDRSLDLVRASDDRQLHSHVLASMAHLADHRGQPDEAVRLARAGREQLANGPHYPDLEAQLAATQARATAALGQPAECRHLLAHAERSLSMEPDEPASPWANGFDQGSLASEIIRSMQRVGDAREMERQAERVIELRPLAQAPRSHAFGKLALITALIGRSDLERACALAYEVVESASWLGSYLVHDRLTALQHRLKPYQGATKAVAEFLDYCQPVLRQHRWLHQRLSAPNRPPARPGLG
jgi:hypothetical protein